MQTPVELEFQDMAASPAVEQQVADHVKKLEQLYGRITACRIVVKGPGHVTRPAGTTISGFGWRCRTATKSISGERRRQTNGIRRWHSPSTMRSSGLAGSFRITHGACGATSRTIRELCPVGS